ALTCNMLKIGSGLFTGPKPLRIPKLRVANEFALNFLKSKQMKYNIWFGLICFFYAVIPTLAQPSQSDTLQLRVSGNCGMCKNRVEKAAAGDQAIQSEWEAKTQTLSLYN